METSVDNLVFDSCWMGAYHSRTQHKKFERGDWQLVAEHTDGRPNLLRHRLHCS